MLKLSHYYGDRVRQLFLAAAFMMAATLPYFSPEIDQPLLMSIMGILVLAIAAGLTSPTYVSSALLNVLVAFAGLFVFESYATSRYQLEGADIFFWANQALALIFLFAFYFGLKTFRGMTKV